MSSRPTPSFLRRRFDQAERAIGAPLENLVATQRFTELLVLGFRVHTGAWRMVESSTRRALHFWNLPTRSDINRLSRQVAALDTKVEALAAAQEQEAARLREAADDDT